MNNIPRESSLNENQIVENYRRIYRLGEEVGIQHALEHWHLERELTDNLWESKVDNRWDVFSDCYTRLYNGLPWLNKKSRDDFTDSFPPYLNQWAKIIPSSARVFEIGSGGAELLRFLSTKGYHCVATEVSKSRGKVHTEGYENIEWHVTDGINLTEFESPGSYDVVLSSGVVEHFIPDDLPVHFSHAHSILKDGGKYIFTTPHVGSGPHDLSAAFGLDQPICMHLKEYDYLLLNELLKAAGFGKIEAVFPPSRIFRKLGITFESSLYLRYLLLIDRIDRDRSSSTRRRFRSLMKLFFVPDNIWLSASK